jgi:aminopeptidase N
MIHDERELLDTDSESLQSHELAHQWFGDYVTCRDWGQIWLNESFATYFQALWHEELKGHEYFLYNDVRGNQEQVLETWNEGTRRPIVTKYFENKDAMFDNYAYPGGAAVLHMLRKHLGDAQFFKSMNHYLTANANQPVSTEDLRIAIEETTGESMDWFFDQWLYRMGHPVFEVTQDYDPAAKKLTLNVKQTQTIDLLNEYPQTRYFQTKVEIEIDGRVEQVWIEPKAENVFTFDAPAKPKIVNFDYEGTLLKELKFDKSVDDLIYQMLNDRDLIGKRWAMEELEARAENASEKDKISAAFLASFEQEKNWNLRRAALSKVKNLSLPQVPDGTPLPPVTLSEKIVSFLLKASKDENSLIRSDAIDLLGATRNAKYADLYIAALNDRSYSVIDSAAQALGASKDAKAFDALTRLTKTPSWKGRIATAGFSGLTALADRRAFEIGYRFAADKNNNYNARTSALSVIGATGKGDERAFPMIFEQFKAALETNDFNGLFISTQSIIKLADPRGQQAFEMLREKFKSQNNIIRFVNVLETQFKAAIGK